MKRLFLFLRVLIGFSSIASAQKTEVKVDYMESSARYLEPIQSIMTTPLIADLSVVSGQISYTETVAFDSQGEVLERPDENIICAAGYSKKG